MREIKFEYGFQSINGIVKKKYYLHEIPNIKEKCDVWNMLQIVYVRQFTGLQDKNGVDIYENDIFHCNKVNYVLKYLTSGGAYTVHNIKDDSDERFLHHCNTQIEIIGNIHEHLNLLK